MWSVKKIVLYLGGVFLSAVICSASVKTESVSDSITVSDSLTVQIFFHRGKSFLDPELSDNRENLRRFFVSLDSLSRLRNIAIDSVVRVRPSASPEGKIGENEALCKRRADLAVAIFRKKGLSGFEFEINSSGEDWSALSSLLKKSGLKGSEEATRIIDNTPVYVIRRGKIVGGRKKAAMDMWRGRFWWKMDRLFFPLLRQVTLTVTYSDKNRVPGKCVSVAAENSEECSDRLAVVKSPLPEPPVASSLTSLETPLRSLLCDHAAFPSQQTFSGRKNHTAQQTISDGQKSLHGNSRACKPVLALKTNLLFDAASLLNLGVEVPIGSRFSLAADVVFPWWRNRSKDVTIQMLGGTLEGRYWFGKRVDREPMTGFFAGIYTGAGYFDFQLGTLTRGNGVQGNFYLLGGVSAGFAHRISNSLRLEYSIGAGYLRCDFQEYFSAKDTKFGDIKAIAYPWEAKRLSGFLPTKASVSLVWMIHSKKGGER